MNERLVVEKSIRHQRIEGFARFAFPPPAAALSYYFFGAGLWQIPIVLTGFAVIALVSNRIAISLGGRLISPAERWQLQIERLKKLSPVAIFFWIFAFVFDVLMSLVVPMTPPEDVSHMLWLFVLISIGGAALASGLCTMYLLQQMRIHSAGQPPPDLQSPWEWLRKSAPFRVIGLTAVIAGYFIAREFLFPTCLWIFLAASWIGLSLEAIVRIRTVKPGPLLWNNFSFAAMLATGLIVYAVPFALLLGLMEMLVGGSNTTSAIFAAGGFSAGLLLAFGYWAVARLNSVRNQSVPQ